MAHWFIEYSQPPGGYLPEKRDGLENRRAFFRADKQRPRWMVTPGCPRHKQHTRVFFANRLRAPLSCCAVTIVVGP